MTGPREALPFSITRERSHGGTKARETYAATSVCSEAEGLRNVCTLLPMIAMLPPYRHSVISTGVIDEPDNVKELAGPFCNFCCNGDGDIASKCR